ncbi:MAG: hypothetical protein M0Q91_07735 [Methanoregula sp.]|jgi:hypothetical protein|nr:hypothetical protein [Methanoregula sp.]
MTGETVLGGFVWRMGVKSTVREDLAGAKKSVDEFDKEIKPATESVSRFTVSTKSLVRPLMDMGQGLTAVGMAAFATGTMMGDAGEGYKLAGTGIMAVGSATMMTMPLLKMFNAFIAGEMTQSIEGFSRVLNISTGQLIGIGSVIGITATAAFLLYKYHQDKATAATIAHKDAMKDAERATDDYSDALKNLQSLKDEQRGIPKTVRELEDKLRRDNLDLAAAQEKLGKGTAREQEYAQLDVNEINRRIEKDWNALVAAQGRGEALPGEIATGTQVLTQAEWNKKVLDILATEGPYKGPANLVESVTRSGTPTIGTGTQYNNDVLQGTITPTFNIGPIYGKFSGEKFTVDLTNKEKLNQQVG